MAAPISPEKGRSIPTDAINSVKGIGVGQILGHSLSAWGAYSDYKSARAEGMSKIGSVASAATEFAMGEMLGWKYLPYQALKAAPAVAVGAMEGISKMQRNMNKTSRQTPFMNSSFQDFSQAYTMRQAGMQAAQQSRYNLQQAMLGNEAQYLR